MFKGASENSQRRRDHGLTGVSVPKPMFKKEAARAARLAKKRRGAHEGYQKQLG
jgi:hypothetical protein